MNATVVEVAKTKIIILVDHVEMTFARKKGSGVVLVGKAVETRYGSS